jgi:uncharacterized MnhB-related membrane protein
MFSTACRSSCWSRPAAQAAVGGRPCRLTCAKIPDMNGGGWNFPEARAVAFFALDRALGGPSPLPLVLTPGPLPVIALGELERGGGSYPAGAEHINRESEVSDRSRAFDPHLIDVLVPARGQQPGHYRAHVGVDEPTRFTRLNAIGVTVKAVEVLRILSDEDADALGSFYGGSRGEVTRVITAVHCTLPAGVDGDEAVGALTRRQEQSVLDDFRSLLAPFGHLRKESPDDLVGASEMPFVLVSGIARPGGQDAGQLHRSFRTVFADVRISPPWTISIWPDLALVTGEFQEDTGFRLGRTTHCVTTSVLVDATMLRIAQREALGALVRRASVGDSDQLGLEPELHRISVRLRARLWWPTVGSLPFVRAFAEGLSEQWTLLELAESADDEISALATEARREVEDEQLQNDKHIAQILLVLTVGSVGVAFVSLVVAIITSDKLTAAVVSGVSSTAVALAVTVLLLRRLRTRHEGD